MSYDGPPAATPTAPALPVHGRSRTLSVLCTDQFTRHVPDAVGLAGMHRLARRLVQVGNTPTRFDASGVPANYDIAKEDCPPPQKFQRRQKDSFWQVRRDDLPGTERRTGWKRSQRTTSREYYFSQTIRQSTFIKPGNHTMTKSNVNLRAMERWRFLTKIVVLMAGISTCGTVVAQTDYIRERDNDPFVFCTQGMKMPAPCWIPIPEYGYARWTYTGVCDEPNPKGRAWTQAERDGLEDYIRVCGIPKSNGGWDTREGPRPEGYPTEH